LTSTKRVSTPSLSSFATTASFGRWRCARAWPSWIFVWIAQRFSHVDALGRQQRVCHAAADDDLVAQLQEPLDHTDLVGHLCPAEDRDKGTVRIGEDRVKDLKLAREQRSHVRR
jgi:hypothetical protein